MRSVYRRRTAEGPTAKYRFRLHKRKFRALAIRALAWVEFELRSAQAHAARLNADCLGDL